MDPFLSLEAVVATAEEGSFRAAGARLGVTSAGISKAIARLEHELDVRLFDRTTRTVALTRAGELYLSHAQRALAEMHRAFEGVEHLHKEVRGELVVALSSVLSNSLCSRLGRFTQRFPGISMRLIFGDRQSRLVEEQIDVALRIGPPGDTRDLGLKLSSLSWVTVASPDYLERKGFPLVPADLKCHDCLGYRSSKGQDVRWVFSTGDNSTDKALALEMKLVTTEGRALVDAARAGVGITQVFQNLVEDDLKHGRLVPLLAEFEAPGPPLHAVFKPGQHESPKVRAFLDFLQSEYRPSRRSSRD